MSNIIDKIQVSGVTYDIGGGSITIDPTLDSGSTNPVANSAITTALDAKVNVADNIVSAATINYTYDVGDTNYKYPYNNGLIINEFYVKPVNQYSYTNTAAWNYMNISNGSSYTEIKVSVDCSNYQITAVTSTSGENFTYAIEDGVLHVTLSEGYFVRTIGQSLVFQISYEKYTIESGQTADVINEDLIDVIQDIYDQVPKAYLSAATPMLDSTRLTILNTKSDGSNSGRFISFGSSIKGDNNKLDAYLPSRYPTNVTLNTGNGNYCQVPSSTFNDYSSAFAYMDLAVNTGYTGSSTSFTFTVKTLFYNNTVQTDTFTYDVANKTIGGNQLYIDVFYVNNTITIYPKQYNFSRIQSVSEPNCKIGGVDSPFKNQYIITGVTAGSYAKQANTVINEIYSELNGKATTTYVNQSTSGKAETTAVTEAISEATSGKVDTSVYTAYTATTDERISQDEEVTAAALNELNEAVSGKQDTLSAGTNITIVDNVISAEGGGKAIEAGRGITVTTGATADTVSFNLPISAGTGSNSIIEGLGTTASGINSHAEGNSTTANGNYSHAEGVSTTASGNFSHAEGVNTTASGISSHAEGRYTIANGSNSHTEGLRTIANNESEYASGQYNISNSASTTFGDSGNTLFSVGNGTGDNARHNAFEIRQNGDIYLSSGGTDIKLQDHLGGGGSVTVDTELDSDSTNPVENRVIYNKIDEVEQVTAAGLNALNDKITPTVELTQAQYDALTTKDPNTYYIITDAQAGDLTNYYTKSETNTLLGGKADTATTYTKTEVDTALSGKQATLVSGTNIKTINNTSILGSGNIDIQGGGGGKAVSGGTNISITTGETADTINCTLNLENGTNSQSGGLKLKSFVAGNVVSGRDACAFGGANQANGTNSFVTGYYNTGNTSGAFVSGNRNQATNGYETLFGLWAISNGSYNDMGGYSDATLLAVGNGEWRTQTKHNAFEIRQNGDIYIADTNDTSTTNWYEKPMIKLQDQLGGSSITVDTELDSGSTNPVQNKVIYNKIDEVEQVTAAGLNALNDNFGGLKLVKLTQAEYNALATKDSSTLYIIVN